MVCISFSKVLLPNFSRSTRKSLSFCVSLSLALALALFAEVPKNLPCNTLPSNAQQTKIETYCETSSPQKRMSEFVLDCGNRLSVRICRGSNSGFGHQMAVMTLPFLVLFNWTAVGIRRKVVWHWIISWKCPVNCLRHVNEYLVTINYCSKYLQ